MAVWPVSCLDLLSLKAEEKDLELVYCWDPAVPTHYQGDSTRIRQVITNLVGNALKFTDTGSVVVRVTHQAQAILFAVEDSGVGIPDDRIDRLFEAFTQADRSTTRQYGGTGLGLPISRRLVEAMGGRLTVESQPCKGSCFAFTLPTGSLTPEPLPWQTAHSLSGQRVALVGIPSKTRGIIRRRLAYWGAEIAKDGDTEPVIVLRYDEVSPDRWNIQREIVLVL